MNKQLLVYTLSIAIDKGSPFLFFPLLLKFLTIEQFGIWSLILILSNLLTPIVSLNGSASILREGSENVSIGKYLLKKYITLILLIGLVVCLLLFFLDNFKENWLFYSALISVYESSLISILTFLRAQNRYIFFLIINILKTTTLFILILFAVKYKIEFSQFLSYQVVIMFVFTFLLFIISYFNSVKIVSITFYSTFMFSLSLIPHSMSQWVMSSSDRLLIEYFINTKSLGIYSLSYNIAMVLTLINTGLGYALPTFLIKNYTKWKEKNYDKKLIKYYSILAIVIFIIIYITFYIDYLYFNFLKYYSSEMINLITINYVALYFLGLYTFYANYLFYHKKGKIISTTTFYAAIINVVSSILLINAFGIIGASIGTLLTYIFYLYYIRLKTIKIENNINFNLIKNISLLVFSITILRLIISNVMF